MADTTKPDHPAEAAGPVVRYEIAGKVARVTLDSVANRNALSSALVTGLHRALDDAIRDQARVVVLGAEGPAFCAGADLKERTAPGGQPPPPDIFARIATHPQPVIAKVCGAVRAGGLGLVLACDVAVGLPQVTFAVPEVQRGLVPAIISVFGSRRIQPRALQRYFLSGEVFDGVEAARIGVLTTVVEPGKIDAAVDAMAADIAKGAPAALATTKRILQEVADTTTKEALAAMAELSQATFASEEGQEGMRAFLERRPPRWHE